MLSSEQERTTAGQQQDNSRTDQCNAIANNWLAKFTVYYLLRTVPGSTGLAVSHVNGFNVGGAKSG